ncbi:hypothetical protein HAX54_022379, partial [Datura stramonium]|nr:hypothetical protein [Datura stramonium]
SVVFEASPVYLIFKHTKTPFIIINSWSDTTVSHEVGALGMFLDITGHVPRYHWALSMLLYSIGHCVCLLTILSIVYAVVESWCGVICVDVIHDKPSVQIVLKYIVLLIVNSVNLVE